MSTMKNYKNSFDASELTTRYCKKLGVNLDKELVEIIRRSFFSINERTDRYESALSEENGNHVDENVIIQEAIGMATRDLVIICSAMQSCIEDVVLTLNSVGNKCIAKGIMDEEIIKSLTGLILLCEECLKLGF